jgi:hypothetical protein
MQMRVKEFVKRERHSRRIFVKFRLTAEAYDIEKVGDCETANSRRVDIGMLLNAKVLPFGSRRPFASISLPIPEAGHSIALAANSQILHRSLQYASVLRRLLLESVSFWQLETAPVLL